MMKINQVVANIKKNPHVESIMQFGSFLRKKQYNDIDLCIFTKKKLSLKQKLALQRGIPEVYDVSFYDDLPVHIKHEVLTKGKILYTNNYYYYILRQIIIINDEFVRYSRFLTDYHEHRMAEL